MLRALWGRRFNLAEQFREALALAWQRALQSLEDQRSVGLKWQVATSINTGDQVILDWTECVWPFWEYLTISIFFSVVPHEISPLRVRSSSWAQESDWIMELSVTIRLQSMSNNKQQSWIIWNPMFLYSPNIQRQVITVDLIRIQVSQSNERRRMKTRTRDMKRSHGRHMSFHVISVSILLHTTTPPKPVRRMSKARTRRPAAQPSNTYWARRTQPSLGQGFSFKHDQK